jgi:hypothetical protein
MAVFSMTLYGIPGIDYVQDDDLAYKTILHVERNGMGFGLIGNNDYVYTNAIGRISFDNVFEGPTIGRPNRYNLESVFVIYKT